MTVSGDPEGYALAYDAGLRAVADQAGMLKETRDRAGALMSAAAVAGGLAAGLTFDSQAVRGIGAAGLISAAAAVVGFVGVVLCTVMIWRPTEGRFSHDAGVLVGSYVEGDPPASLAEIHRELALWLGTQTESNRAMLEGKLKTFPWALAALLMEIGGTVVALGASPVAETEKSTAPAPRPPEPSRPDPSISERRGARGHDAMSPPRRRSA